LSVEQQEKYLITTLLLSVRMAFKVTSAVEWVVMSVAWKKLKKTSGEQKKPTFLTLHLILTFWIFIVSCYVLSIPLSHSLCADKLSNSVTNAVKKF
jgi:hypothetical protein